MPALPVITITMLTFFSLSIRRMNSDVKMVFPLFLFEEQLTEKNLGKRRAISSAPWTWKSLGLIGSGSIPLH
jgi:hypothetical protein